MFLFISIVSTIPLHLEAQESETPPIAEANKGNDVSEDPAPSNRESELPKEPSSTQSKSFPLAPKKSESIAKPTSTGGSNSTEEKPNDPPSDTDPLVLPLIIASIVLAILTGGLLAYFMVLRARGRSFAALREEVLSGSKEVPLLTTEALEMISQFKGQLMDSAADFHGKADEHRSSVEGFISRAEKTANESHAKTHETVDTFKGSMNNMLESLQKFMGKVVEDAKRTRDEAAETKELTKQVAAVLQEKEEQLRQLEEGYQKSLLGPLTKEFLNLRDELLSISEQTEGEISNHLDAIDKKFVKALAETGIHEIAINGRPDDLPPGFWETVGAATPTENSEKHGTVERIYTRGYTVCRPDGEKAVLRKAVVVLYAHSPDSSEPLSTSHS